MSNNNLLQFIQVLKTDATLQEKLRMINDLGSFHVAVVEFARAIGLNLTAEDVKELTHQAPCNETEELSEWQLLSVAGGAPKTIERVAVCYTDTWCPETSDFC